MKKLATYACCVNKENVVKPPPHPTGYSIKAYALYEKKDKMDNSYFKLKTPFTCIVSGPTKAGKTTVVKSLIKNADTIFDVKFSKIWWFYGEDQESYKSLEENVTFIQGVPDLDKMDAHPSNPQLVILDDLMQEMKNNPNLTKLFTKVSHHRGVSVIHIVQNLFFEGTRTSRINCDYIFLMKNPSDKLQVQTLSHQLFPNNYRYFLEAYEDATDSPYSYLLVDLTQTMNENYRLRASIFDKMIIYTPKV